MYPPNYQLFFFLCRSCSFQQGVVAKLPRLLWFMQHRHPKSCWDWAIWDPMGWFLAIIVAAVAHGSMGCQENTSLLGWDHHIIPMESISYSSCKPLYYDMIADASILISAPFVIFGSGFRCTLKWLTPVFNFLPNFVPWNSKKNNRLTGHPGYLELVIEDAQVA